MSTLIGRLVFGQAIMMLDHTVRVEYI